MGVLRPIEVGAKQLLTDACWIGSRFIANWSDPRAVAFYDTASAYGFEFDELLRVIPTLRTIYVAVPKAASTRIKMTLAAAVGCRSASLRQVRRRRFRGPQGPKSMTMSAFHKLATDPTTLRFSFVRNPYARAVSCWADKFQGKPLVGGDDYVEGYLARRGEVDARLPAGTDATLSFADFVTYATGLASRRVDSHLQLQDDILGTPGINFNMVGRVEAFRRDFRLVLDHIGAGDELRSEADSEVNPSQHGPWMDYYTGELRERIYRAYERDFDRFGYPRRL